MSKQYYLQYKLQDGMDNWQDDSKGYNSIGELLKAVVLDLLDEFDLWFFLWEYRIIVRYDSDKTKDKVEMVLE